MMVERYSLCFSKMSKFLIDLYLKINSSISPQSGSSQVTEKFVPSGVSKLGVATVNSHITLFSLPVGVDTEPIGPSIKVKGITIVSTSINF